MKKTTKTLLALVIILVVLVLGYVALIMFYKTDEEKGTETEVETVDETTYVIDLDGVSAIRYTDGTTEMAFTQGDTEWAYEADGTITLDENAIGTMVYEFQQVVAVRTIEKPDALADYGLENPSYTVEITDLGGNVVTLYIGDAVDDCYYATTGDKEVVYVINSSVVEALEFDINNLMATELEETEYSEEDTEDTTSVTEDTTEETVEETTSEDITEDTSNEE